MMRPPATLTTDRSTILSRKLQLGPSYIRMVSKTTFKPVAHLSSSLRASFWRGGTSKGVFIPETFIPFRWKNQQELHSKLQKLLASIMGSPDSFGRQLNGMGGGISSLSKAVIYRPAPDGDADADVEYLFCQIGIKDGKLDISGNCGNLTSVVGPVALNEGYVKTLQSPSEHNERQEVTVRLRNLNTSKIIHSIIVARSLQTNAGLAWRYDGIGDYSIDGVSGTASKVLLRFTAPGGAKTGRTLPTGNPTDTVVTAADTVQASLIDVTNPGIFVDGRTLSWTPNATPDQLNAQTSLMERLELIRRRGTEMMGLDPNDLAVPKIVLVFPPSSLDVDVSCQALSMETAHKAVPGTLALNLGAACKLPGTVPSQLCRQREGSTVVIGHPSGKAEVGAIVKDGIVESVELGRTARCLMDGFVNYDPS